MRSVYSLAMSRWRYGSMFDFASLMPEVEMISDIKKTRQEMQELLDIFLSQPDRQELTEIFAEGVRHLDTKTLLDADSFMIQDDDELLYVPSKFCTETYGLFRNGFPIFRGRYIYPVKDLDGLPMGWVGYDKYSDVKYLDSKNYGYKAKHTTLWGMDKLPEYYKSGRQVWFVEGIVCALYLRQCGEQSMAFLGSAPTPYVWEIVRRFGDKARIVADSDSAGNKLVNSAKRSAKQSRVFQSSIAKDLDDSKELAPDLKDIFKNYESPFYMHRYLIGG